MQTGLLDLLPALACSREREALIDFTFEAVIVNLAQFYSAKEHSLGSVLTLQGKRCGVKAGDILVIDDLEGQLSLAAVILEILGYQVKTATSGFPPIRYSRRHLSLSREKCVDLCSRMASLQACGV